MTKVNPKVINIVGITKNIITDVLFFNLYNILPSNNPTDEYISKVKNCPNISIMDIPILKSENVTNVDAPIPDKLFKKTTIVSTKYAESLSITAGFPETVSTINFKINSHKTVNIANPKPSTIVEIIVALI